MWHDICNNNYSMIKEKENIICNSKGVTINYQEKHYPATLISKLTLPKS